MSANDLHLPPPLEALFQRRCRVCGCDRDLSLAYRSTESESSQKFMRVELIGDGETLCPAHLGRTRHQEFLEKKAAEEEAAKRERISLKKRKARG